MPQRPQNGHDNALKGYALPSDGATPHAAQPPAQDGHAQRPQQAQRRLGAKPKPAATPGHDAPARSANETPVVRPAQFESAAEAAEVQRAAEGPSNGRHALQNGGGASGNATQRLAGKKRKLVGDVQQAGIVSSILAQREPAKRNVPAGAQSGMPLPSQTPKAWLMKARDFQFRSGPCCHHQCRRGAVTLRRRR